MAHAGVWFLTGSTFLLALYALIDQSALRRDLSAQVFRVRDGTATVASNVKRVILAPEKPNEEVLSALPPGTIYIGAKLQFATGHILDQDPRGNLVLSSVQDGIPTRLATFSPHGAVGFGQLPLSTFQETTRNLYLTGSPSDTVRDGWQSNGTTMITDGNGNTVGTLSNVFDLSNPSRTGVQVFSKGANQAITFAQNGQVSIGTIDHSLYDSNKKASLLVGGDVVVDASARTINYKCQNIQTFAPGQHVPHLSVSTHTANEFIRYENGVEDYFQNTAYFNLSQCYPMEELPFLTLYNTDLPQNSYIKTNELTCQNEKSTATVFTYLNSDCSGSVSSVDISLNTVYSSQKTTRKITFRCWLPSDKFKLKDVKDMHEPTTD